MLSNYVLVVIQLYIFERIGPMNKNLNILQIIHTKAQTNEVIPYCFVLQCIHSNGRLKTIFVTDCLKGFTGTKQITKSCCNFTYYLNVVQSMTIRICDTNYSVSTISKSIHSHMKERELNKDSGTVMFLNIPLIGEILYGYN